VKAEAQRVQKIAPYLFARIEKKIEDAKEKGVDIISLGIGDPDCATAGFIIEEMTKEIHNSVNHQYPSSQGMLAYRQAIADWYQRRFGVDLNPRTEVCALIGSKEGIANINYCYTDPGDVNLVPDPGYPVYGAGTMFAGGESYLMPLKEENGFIPDLDGIPTAVADKAKILWINYPNNPTGAIAGMDFFEKVVYFAKKHDILVCHDNAYSEMTYDGYVAPSFLETPGAMEVGIEFNSLSKPFNMTGWRIGFVVGNARAVGTLAKYKSNVDSGAFQAVQLAAAKGLNDPRGTEFMEKMKRIYEGRRNILVGGLNSMGWNLPMPKATFYVWAPVPKGYDAESFAEKVLTEAGVVITPGAGYGPTGDGYFRATLTQEEGRMQEAIDRMKKALGKVEF